MIAAHKEFYQKKILTKIIKIFTFFKHTPNKNINQRMPKITLKNFT